MDIKLSYDSSGSSAPAAFKTALQFAAQYLDTLITNPITVRISVGYGEFEQTPLTGGESEGGPQGQGLSYTHLVGDLTANATSAAQQEAVANLPASDPTNGGQFLVADAQLKAWGAMPADSNQIDGWVGFGVSAEFPYDYSTNGTTAPGELDFVGIAEHELTHALGRISGLQFAPGWYAPQDLFRYSAPGALELQSGVPAYFSIDGGATNLDNFSTIDDPGDWASSAVGDAFDAISQTGMQNVMTATDITEMNVLGFAIACFAAGTRISTTRGPVAVEALRVGDIAITARGGGAPVVWLGTRRVACHLHPRPNDVWPIRVQAHAFAPGRPVRGIRLSPDHAVLVGGALIPIRYLVNGASIAQEPCDTIEYWHVELPAHDVLLAEDLPAESFLDTGNRSAFAGATPAAALHPEFSRGVWRRDGCAPLLLGGSRVRAERRRLLARAALLGHAATDDPALSVVAGGGTLPTLRDGLFFRVRLPGGGEWIRLRSRTWTPAHVDPRSDDARVLGVALRRLWLDGREASLDSPALRDGWHVAEPGWRWTSGDAALPVAGVREVAFELAMTGRYWLRPLLAGAARA
jgi:hypothetical protein